MPRITLLLLAAAPVFAQLPSNTLTISATRSPAPQPDEAVFAVTVNSVASATLGQIVAALSNVGITSSNLSGVDNSTATTLQWNFTFAAPLANLAAAINSFANLQQTIGQNNSGLTLGFNVIGTQVSEQLQQSQQTQVCSNSALISDATAQAQKIAAAA